mmetsp:Transcript_50454/g.117774  ORF Transcript_50454/g.117774 Transcript_50454/m.117774 type:complete len:703 (-) Transcript_50454:140-2248(-)
MYEDSDADEYTEESYTALSQDDDPFKDKYLYDEYREHVAAATGVAYPLDADEVNERVTARLDAREEKIQEVTGEPGDVQRDPLFWSGRSTLMFKDVRFAVRQNAPKGLAKLMDPHGGEEKVILEPTSGICRPGEIIALMGPSGCGKSTLLDMLADKKTAPYSGDILYNGHERDPKMYSRVTSYVPQEDIMWAHATVRETIEFVEQLAGAYPSHVSHEIREKRIESILRVLGLSKVADTKIGDQTVRGISGGQKRRVTLAKSFVSFAEIIFADEPTSGLSSTDAEICIKAMRYISHAAGTVFVVVIHQPRIEVVRLFDRLFLLTAQPGRVVFNGSFKECEAFYEKVGYPVPEHANPADHYLDMITPGAKGADPDFFVENYHKHHRSKVQQAVENAISKSNAEQWPDELEVLEQKNEQLQILGELPDVRYSKTATSFSTQFGACVHRRLTLLFRDKQGLFKTYFLAIFKSLLLGIGFLKVSRQSPNLQLGAFYVVTLMVAMSSMIDMPRLIDERYKMKIEVGSSLYSEMAFILPFIFVNAIINFTANTLFAVIVFLFATWSPQLFPMFFFWVTLGWAAFDSLFAMVAALAPTAQAASGIGILFNFVFVMYNGFTITEEWAPAAVAWLIKISPAAYVIEGLALNGQEWAPEGNCSYCRPAWDQLIEMFNFTGDNFWIGVCLCLWYAFIFRVGQIFFLIKLHKPQK